MKKVVAIGFILFWCVLLVGIGGYYVAAAPRESGFSEEENRMLAAMPEISVSSALRLELSQGMEDYLLDHFPGRPRIIADVGSVKDLLSVATYEEYLQIADGSTDPLDSEDYEGKIDQLVSEIISGVPTPAPGGAGAGEQPAVTDPPGDGSGESTGEQTGDGTGEQLGDGQETKGENPPIEKKPEAHIEDFPELVGIYAELDGATVKYKEYNRNNALALTAVLNQYAALLPENGKLMFTMVPQSSVGNKFFNSSKNGRFYSNFSEVVNAFGNDNVYSFDAAALLSPAMAEGEYVYFRSDMHWTPYGSYLVYREMAERAGKVPGDYDNDYEHIMETPFLGTYYRDNPTSYMAEHADDLDLLKPKYPLEWRRTTAKDEYKLIDFLNFNAAKNDRYTVYLGGPAGPWTYAEIDNGETENCLVIMDSFGLGFLPLLTVNYKQVHYYDPRYFQKDRVGYSVAEMIEKYEIQDIYVVIGDLHSFNSDFIISTAKEQLGAVKKE